MGDLFDWAEKCPDDFISEDQRVDIAMDRLTMALEAKRIRDLTDEQIYEGLKLCNQASPE